MAAPCVQYMDAWGQLRGSLEHVPQCELHAAGVAVEYLVPFPEVGIAGNQERAAGRIGAVQLHGIDIAGRVLGVIEDVAEITPELDIVPFLYRELLCKGHIEIVNRASRQRVAAAVLAGPIPF